jgi:PAS domain-containing protein
MPNTDYCEPDLRSDTNQLLYEALFEHSPDGIVVLDPETARPLRFNTAAHQQLGYSCEEFCQLSLILNGSFSAGRVSCSASAPTSLFSMPTARSKP